MVMYALYMYSYNIIGEMSILFSLTCSAVCFYCTEIVGVPLALTQLIYTTHVECVFSVSIGQY